MKKKHLITCALTLSILLSSTCLYANDENRASTQIIEDDVPLQHVDQLPRPGNKQTKFNEYLSEQIKYPEDLTEFKKILNDDNIVAQFLVAVDGSISNVLVSGCSSAQFAAEIKTCLEKMPKWEPAIYQDNPSPYLFQLPLNVTASGLKYAIKEKEAKYKDGTPALMVRIQKEVIEPIEKELGISIERRLQCSLLLKKTGKVAEVKVKATDLPSETTELIENKIEGMQGWDMPRFNNQRYAGRGKLNLQIDKSGEQRVHDCAEPILKMPNTSINKLAAQYFADKKVPNKMKDNPFVVRINFDVEGNRTGMEVTNSVDKKFDPVILEFFNTLPTFTPATRDGENVEGYIIFATVKNRDKLIFTAEKRPSFAGGKDAMSDFLRENLDPSPAVKSGALNDQRVIVRFYIDTNGDIYDTKIIKSLSSLTDAEAMRVVKSMPRWEPAMHDDMRYCLSYTLPIGFKNYGKKGKTMPRNKHAMDR